MSTPDERFRQVLAEAGEDGPGELPRGERTLAELQAGLAELNAGRMARWQRLAASRRAGMEAYRQACEAAGIEPRPLDHLPWMNPPPPCQIW